MLQHANICAHPTLTNSLLTRHPRYLTALMTNTELANNSVSINQHIDIMQWSSHQYDYKVHTTHSTPVLA